MPETTLARKALKAVAILTVSAVLGLGVLLGSLWLEHRSETTLPVPTGSFAVGRAIYDWTDDAAADPLAPVPGTRRELLVWIWYPSAAGPDAPKDAYVPAQILAGAGPGGGFWSLLTRDPSKVHGHSTRDAAVSPRQSKYPVVVMRGGASAWVVDYSTLAEDLASHGYIVVGFDAPYRTNLVVFPDGRVMRRTPENNPELCLEQADQARCADRLITAWTGDTAFVLNRLEQWNAADPTGRFTGRLDMTRVGVFGHSFGGAAAAQFCHDDSRCKAGIDIDGAPQGSVIESGIDRPFLFLLSDHSRDTDPESRQIKADIQSIYTRLPPNGRLRVAIRGANHFTFSDDGALMKSRLVRGVLRAFGRLRIGGRRQLAISAHCIHTFFDAYLKGTGSSRPALASPLYPEIQVLE